VLALECTWEAKAGGHAKQMTGTGELHVACSTRRSLAHALPQIEKIGRYNVIGGVQKSVGVLHPIVKKLSSMHGLNILWANKWDIQFCDQTGCMHQLRYTTATRARANAREIIRKRCPATRRERTRGRLYRANEHHLRHEIGEATADVRVPEECQ
jgi:hypothetical protein